MRAVLCAVALMLGDATRSFFSTNAIYRPTTTYKQRSSSPSMPNIVSKRAAVYSEAHTDKAVYAQYVEGVSFLPTLEIAQLRESSGWGWMRAIVGAFLVAAATAKRRRFATAGPSTSIASLAVSGGALPVFPVGAGYGPGGAALPVWGGALQRRSPRLIPGARCLHTSRSGDLRASAAPDMRYVSAPASDAAAQVANPVKYPRGLYPDLEAHETGMLDVGDGHSIYYDVSGNPNGVPAVFLHGGPGAGSDARSRTFFDPAFYRIVVYDQRGSGRSSPNAADDLEGSLRENTTPKLVADIEALRLHLKVSKWGLVLGGSWGSTLALAYAEAYPSRVSSLLLRGVFLFGPDEVDYLFSSGGIFGQNPAAWESYCRYIEDTSTDWARERTNLLGAYWARLKSEDRATREAAAAAFVGYELSISKTFIDPEVLKKYMGTPTILIPFAVMEVHYMINAGFIRRGQLLDNVAVMAEHGHRVAIVHGRGDYVCQPQAAWRLAKALEAVGVTVDLEFVSGAGHSDSEPGLADAMVRATDGLREFLK